MTDLDELLGIDMNDPVQKRAVALVEADTRLLGSLVEARKLLGLSVQQVATDMGTTVEAVYELESFSSDPRLSTLRRYALAVGVTVTHRVSR